MNKQTEKGNTSKKDTDFEKDTTVAQVIKQPQFLPTTQKEMHALGWDCLDILFVSGDAYVDHPSFAAALLGRWLVTHGFRVGIIAQPAWEGEGWQNLLAMGKPRLCTAISAGCVDSMLAHYTAFRKKRSDDAYTPGGQAGARPNRATIVYANMARRAFPDVPLVIGGIEASLRRISHYDFWQDALRRSLLFDTRADLLVYGMGESAFLEIAQRLEAQLFETPDGDTAENSSKKQQDKSFLWGIKGTAFLASVSSFVQWAEQAHPDFVSYLLPSHATMFKEPFTLLQATRMLEQQVHNQSEWVIQPTEEFLTPESLPKELTQASAQVSYVQFYAKHTSALQLFKHSQETKGIVEAAVATKERAVVLTPPASPLTEERLDKLYGLPFTRLAHPSYTQPVPALTVVQESVVTHRGCGGGCSFCSLALHQGRCIASRSRNSIVQEVQSFTQQKWWKGVITDVGGPSANMWQAFCKRSDKKCVRESCMVPKLCPFFIVDQKDNVDLLDEISSIPKVKHVRVASGVRFDLALQEAKALAAYTMRYTGGQLKVAPEHICEHVLTLMRKPQRELFEKFLEAFAELSHKAGKEQYVIPYLLSAFPGCTKEDMQEMADWLKKRHWTPQQVQCFIPTPGTVATAMYYSEQDTKGNHIFVAKTDAQRLEQHYLLVPSHGNKQFAKSGNKSAFNRPAGKNASDCETGNSREKTFTRKKQHVDNKPASDTQRNSSRNNQANNQAKHFSKGAHKKG